MLKHLKSAHKDVTNVSFIFVLFHPAVFSKQLQVDNVPGKRGTEKRSITGSRHVATSRPGHLETENR